MKKTHVLLFEGYADWEIGNVLAELRRLGQLEVVTVGFDDKPVISMGGLRVTPDHALNDIDFDDILIFIVPGGYMWERGYPEEIMTDLLKNLIKRNIPIAAICAATTVLAKAGLFHDRKHTSNSLSYLQKAVPEYSAEEKYIDQFAVSDKNIITASGLGAVDFTMEILTELDVAGPEMRQLWYDAFKHGKYPEEIDHSV